MITTFTDHDPQECSSCATALADARVNAKATGSVGCRSSRDETASGGERHHAAWFRDGRDPRPVPVGPLTQDEEDLLVDLGYGGAL